MNRRLAALALFVVLIVADVIIWRQVYAPREARVEVIAPGAVLVTAPSGRRLLYGAGKDASILRALGAALPYGARRIDVVVEAAPAGAEAGGLPSVLARYQIGMFINAGENPPAALRAALSAAGISATTATRGMRLNLGGLTAEILFPDRDISRASASYQVVVIALHTATTTLLLDDAPSSLEPFLGQLNKNEPAPELIISTSTPPGVYLK